MDDPTDTVLAVVTGVCLACCAVGGCWAAWKNARPRPTRQPGMKLSPSMEHLADAASDDTADPVNNNIV